MCVKNMKCNGAMLAIVFVAGLAQLSHSWTLSSVIDVVKEIDPEVVEEVDHKLEAFVEDNHGIFDEMKEMFKARQVKANSIYDWAVREGVLASDKATAPAGVTDQDGSTSPTTTTTTTTTTTKKMITDDDVAKLATKHGAALATYGALLPPDWQKQAVQVSNDEGITVEELDARLANPIGNINFFMKFTSSGQLLRRAKRAEVVRDPRTFARLLSAMLPSAAGSSPSYNTMGETDRNAAGSADSRGRSGSVGGSSLNDMSRYFWYGNWCGLGHGFTSVGRQECCGCGATGEMNQVDIKQLIGVVSNCTTSCRQAPIDEMDAACALHDVCYSCTTNPLKAEGGEAGLALCQCEKLISTFAANADCESVHERAPLHRQWCRFFKKMVPVFFGMKPCYCPTLQNPPPSSIHRRPDGLDRYVVYGYKQCPLD